MSPCSFTRPTGPMRVPLQVHSRRHLLACVRLGIQACALHHASDSAGVPTTAAVGCGHPRLVERRGARLPRAASGTPLPDPAAAAGARPRLALTRFAGHRDYATCRGVVLVDGGFVFDWGEVAERRVRRCRLWNTSM